LSHSSGKEVERLGKRKKGVTGKSTRNLMGEKQKTLIFFGGKKRVPLQQKNCVLRLT